MTPLAAPLLQGPPDTVSFLILGYILIGAVGLGYVISLVLRQRRLTRDLDIIDELYREGDGDTG